MVLATLGWNAALGYYAIVITVIYQRLPWVAIYLLPTVVMIMRCLGHEGWDLLRDVVCIATIKPPPAQHALTGKAAVAKPTQSCLPLDSRIKSFSSTHRERYY